MKKGGYTYPDAHIHGAEIAGNSFCHIDLLMLNAHSSNNVNQITLEALVERAYKTGGVVGWGGGGRT